MSKSSVLCWTLILTSPLGLSADPWPQWRGPRGDGVSEESNIPEKFGPDSNVLWKTPLPGPAGSTPVIWGDRIYLTSAINKDLALLALDTSGKILWTETLASGNETVRGDEGNYASPSPSTDGDHVWAMFGTGLLTCRDKNGKEVWTVDLQKRYGKFNIQFGMTSTPVLDGDRLYLMCMYTGASYVACLDKSTGNEIWKIDRKSDAIEECEHSYASPILYREGNIEYLLIHGADYCTAHSLKDGSEIWRVGGLNGKALQYNPTLRFVASPVGAEGLIVVPSAKKGPVLGIKPTATGIVTTETDAHAWRLPRNTPDVPSPLVHGGIVYLCGEDGVLTTLDAVTGSQIYTERVHVGRHRASPVYADGKVFLTSRSGMISVVKAGREYQLLAQNNMDEEVSSSLAIADGKIYVRTFKHLYAIGK